jgi:hypothetical protein
MRITLLVAITSLTVTACTSALENPVTEELKVIEGTMRVKKCSTPENWGSTSAIR